MKAVAVTGKRKAEVIEVETPVPRHGQVLIRIHTCLLCTWEQRIFSGQSSMDLPFIPGHEASGVIEEIPQGTLTTLKTGDHVVFKTLDDCGHCSFCYQGYDNLCGGTPEKRVYGNVPSSGGLAEYIALDLNKVFPMSREVSHTEAAFAEPLACCVHSIRRVNPDLGETAVIIGAGIMGMLHLKLLLLKGCRVVMIEPREDRRFLAKKAGAHFALDPKNGDVEKEILALTGGEGVEYVFFTASKSHIAEESFKYLRKMGSIVYYGSFHPNDPIPVDPNKIHYGEFIITGSYSPSTRDFFTASRLLSGRLVDVREFISLEVERENAGKAFEAALDPDTFRVAINF